MWLYAHLRKWNTHGNSSEKLSSPFDYPANVQDLIWRLNMSIVVRIH